MPSERPRHGLCLRLDGVLWKRSGLTASGWDGGFAWVSGSPEFGADFGVSSYDGHRPGNYNYRESGFEGELPGLSAFYRLADGGVAHSYSTYARGLDRLNPAYQFLDSTHLGRQEESEAHTMAWVRRHDRYD